MAAGNSIGGHDPNRLELDIKFLTNRVEKLEEEVKDLKAELAQTRSEARIEKNLNREIAKKMYRFVQIFLDNGYLPDKEFELRDLMTYLINY